MDGSGEQALQRHWLGNRRWIAALTALWALVTFAPVLFAPQLDFELFGAPVPVWVAAQGAPVVYLLIVAAYDWAMRRLDRGVVSGREG